LELFVLPHARAGLWYARPIASADIDDDFYSGREDSMQTTLYRHDLFSWLEGSDGTWRSQLRVDETNPYFFDHPLDHVPGILLIEGFLRLTEHAVAQQGDGPDGATAHVSFLDIALDRFCEKDRPTRLEATRIGSRNVNCWRVTALQGEHRLCSGEVVLTYAHALPNDDDASSRATGPAPRAEPAWVHNTVPDNVFVGPVQDLAGGGYAADVLAPPPDHVLRASSPDLRTTGELLEAARQFGVMVAHLRDGVPLGLQWVMHSAAGSFTGPLPRTAPLRVSASPGPQKARSDLGYRIHLDAGGVAVGTMLLRGRAASPAAYARFRAMNGR
jgi:2-oxo-3-(phosphooxy)propyl 3-oxoalkanoate synthase